MAIFTYNINSTYYTDECNNTVNFIIRSLPDVRVIDSDAGFIQIHTNNPNTADALNFLADMDCVELYPDMTIEDMSKVD